MPIFFFSSVKKFVNEVNDWLIKTNSSLIGEFMFKLNAVEGETIGC